MKNKITRILSIVMVLAFLVSTMAVAASAETAVEAPKNVITSVSEDVEITIFPNVIVTYFRIHYGVAQYRRWNETRGYWVDPYWIDL